MAGLTMASPQTIPAQARAKVALLISPFQQDHEILHSLFREQGWRLYGTDSLRSGLPLLRRRAASVVITEHNLPTGSWRDVLDAARLLPAAPLVVISSIHADDYLWAEALNLGAYDVLSKPIEPTEAIRAFNGLGWDIAVHTRWPRLAGKTACPTIRIQARNCWGGYSACQCLFQ